MEYVMKLGHRSKVKVWCIHLFNLESSFFSTFHTCVETPVRSTDIGITNEMFCSACSPKEIICLQNDLLVQLVHSQGYIYSK